MRLRAHLRHVGLNKALYRLNGPMTLRMGTLRRVWHLRGLVMHTWVRVSLQSGLPPHLSDLCG